MVASEAGASEVRSCEVIRGKAAASVPSTSEIEPRDAQKGASKVRVCEAHARELCRPPRVACFHDFSGHGAAGLNVALPVLSAHGWRVSALPGAILSTQTDGFGDYVFRDETAFFQDALRHWETLNLRFDWIYSGFLGSARQMEVLSETHFFADAETPAKRFVDPVLGDGGVLYDTMGELEVAAMWWLSRGADLLTPNLTELLSLLGQPLSEEARLLALPVDELKKEVAALAEKLRRKLEVKNLVLTGIPLGTDIACFVASDTIQAYVCAPSVRAREDAGAAQSALIAHMPGTGDLFAAWLLKGIESLSLVDAVREAMQAVADSMRASQLLGLSPAEGPCFQSILPAMR